MHPKHRAFVVTGRFRRFFSNLGPGLITGAADDDPSGIATYAVTGASLGYAPLWTALFSFPLMAAVQIMCARLGLVTGLGLAGVVRRHSPRWVLWGACVLLVVANVVNIGADLGGMASVTGLSPLCRLSISLRSTRWLSSRSCSGPVTGLSRASSSGSRWSCLPTSSTLSSRIPLGRKF
ncbi:MAG TPA: divalent metal cation transporter [Bryobacteraceae bacterium]|nr:divalent metal cation transporter [Bryobacteraceae bacterium]